MFCLLYKCLLNVNNSLMSIFFNTILGIVNFILFLLIFKELSCMPELKNLLEVMIHAKVSTVAAYTFVTFMFCVLPLLTTTIVLCYMKKRLFNSSKSLGKSYVILRTLLISTYLLRIFKVLFLLYTKLGISKSFYVYTRLSKYYNAYTSKITLYEIFMGFLVHALIYIISVLIAEMVIVYSQITTNITFIDFAKKHVTLILSVLGIVMYYLIVIIYIECNVGIFKHSFGTGLALMVTRIYESILINGLSVYIYIMLGMNGLI
ncbi:hypothetical protein NUSPORA_01450 [Nucleospora cyclopteri]